MTIIAESTTENRDVYPVFRGLTELGLSTADLARALGASPAAVAAWRCGDDRMPARLIAFLTLVLDALVDRKGSEAVVATSRHSVASFTRATALFEPHVDSPWYKQRSPFGERRRGWWGGGW